MGSILNGMITTNLKKVIRGITIAKSIKIITDDNTEGFGSAVLTDANQLCIQFEAVNFSYPSKPKVQVLRNLSFQIDSQQKVGFVGLTGCGKSTIAQLLLGFYSPSSGSIEINGEI